MNELNELLKPTWGAEKWINEGWEKISRQEKDDIIARMDELFKDGLPFELKFDKLRYIYAFSLLAQLEVLAVQIPLKFEDKLSSPELRATLHHQLLDEIFHGMVFTKIVYLLCAPHALPPAYNESVETLCNFIREESDPKTAIVMLNLIGEGWIEEIFSSFHQQGIAPKVFEVILEDEHRHVCEADLYREIGLPDKLTVSKKLEFLEEHLITKLFMQYKYVMSVSSLLGADGASQFLRSIDEKHTQQLTKLDLEPSHTWQYFMSTFKTFLPEIEAFGEGIKEQEMTPIRKVLMTQWRNPLDPTMAGEFNINVTDLDFFGKKFPKETITTLMLQTISEGLSTEDSFRNFLSFNQLYQSEDSFTALVVKLPGCGDQMGYVVFKNCHQITMAELVMKIKKIVGMMTFCYQKRAELEAKNPDLKLTQDKMLYDIFNDVYNYPLPGNSVVCLSNIGFCGFTQAKSPLRVNEGLKFTLFEIDKKPVWNHQTNEFEPQDLLPVSISADHRIFDGNLAIPKLIQKTFKKRFEQFLHECHNPSIAELEEEISLAEVVEELAIQNEEVAYQVLNVLQTVWVDYMELPDLVKKMSPVTSMLEEEVI